MHRKVLGLAVVAAIAIAACGGDDDDGGGASETAAEGSEAPSAGSEAPAGTEAPSGTEASEGSEAPAGEATEGGEVVIALEAEPRTLDPQITQDGQMRRVAENIFERLVDRDLDDPGTLVPRLAAELPTNIDDTTWEVKLREGVTFHNGEPFNAESAAWSINREIDPEYDSELLSQVNTIESAEAIDEYTIRITTTGPDPVLPSRLYMIQQVPLEYSKDEAFARNPVGTGPYKFVEWAAGDQITIEANEDYWGEAPSITDATFRFLPENQSRIAALQSGEVDLAMAIPPESAEDVPQTITRDGLEYPYIRLKNYEGPFQNEQVRQALAHALNVPQYIESIYGGNATQAQCQTNGPAVFGFNEELKPYEYDPELSKQLLEEAGYNGEPARIIAPTGRWLKFEELAEAIQADMDAVGLNATIEMIQFDPWLTEFIQHIGEGQPDGALSSTSNELLDGDRISSLVGKSGSVSSFDSPELEAQLAEARTELDLDAREQAYKDVAKEICDTAANIALLTFQDIYGASEELQWTPRIDGTSRVEEMTLTN
jgi:peptide/nickel transport system substrate-binding protein